MEGRPWRTRGERGWNGEWDGGWGGGGFQGKIQKRWSVEWTTARPRLVWRPRAASQLPRAVMLLSVQPLASPPLFTAPLLPLHLHKAAADRGEGNGLRMGPCMGRGSRVVVVMGEGDEGVAQRL